MNGMKTLLSLILCLSLVQAVSQDLKEISLTNVVSGKAESVGQDAVVIFFCHTCPYATHYIERIKSLSSTTTIPIYLVNPSNDFKQEESEARMKTYAQSVQLNVSYLSDKDQQLFKALNASKCPEAVVLKGGKVMYRGAIDDNPQVASQVKNRYLESAISNATAGKSSANTRPVGCTVKPVRE